MGLPTSYMDIEKIVKNKEQLIRGNEQEKEIRGNFVSFANEAIRAADPRITMKEMLTLEGPVLNIKDEINQVQKRYNLDNYRRVFLFGCGKAGESMARTVYDILGDRVTEGIVLIKQKYKDKDKKIPLPMPEPIGNIKFLPGTHPDTTELTFNSTRKLMDKIKSYDLTEKDLVFYVISGGGSAIQELPAEGISLDDYVKMNPFLKQAGATIVEMNAVRKHISQIKGGQFAKLVYPAKLVNLLLSDVIGNRLDTIASGPSSPDQTTYAYAIEVLKKYKRWDDTPAKIKEHLEKGKIGGKGAPKETPKEGDECFKNCDYFFVGSLRKSCMAVYNLAEKMGYKAEFVTDQLEEPVEKLSNGLIKNLVKKAKPGVLYVLGGEPTLKIDKKKLLEKYKMNEAGEGGRMTNLALRCAPYCKKHGVYMMVLATDGKDGGTQAGAIVTPDTNDKIVDMITILEKYEDGKAFKDIGDLIVTEDTGTNVNNLIILSKIHKPK